MSLRIRNHTESKKLIFFELSKETLSFNGFFFCTFNSLYCGNHQTSVMGGDLAAVRIIGVVRNSEVSPRRELTVVASSFAPECSKAH